MIVDNMSQKPMHFIFKSYSVVKMYENRSHKNQLPKYNLNLPSFPRHTDTVAKINEDYTQKKPKINKLVRSLLFIVCISNMLYFSLKLRTQNISMELYKKGKDPQIHVKGKDPQIHS